VNIYDPADDIVYVHMAPETADTYHYLTPRQDQAVSASRDAPMTTHYHRASSACGVGQSQTPDRGKPVP
jgi:hypothetical protein